MIKYKTFVYLLTMLSCASTHAAPPDVFQKSIDRLFILIPSAYAVVCVVSAIAIMVFLREGLRKLKVNQASRFKLFFQSSGIAGLYGVVLWLPTIFLWSHTEAQNIFHRTMLSTQGDYESYRASGKNPEAWYAVSWSDFLIDSAERAIYVTIFLVIMVMLFAPLGVFVLKKMKLLTKPVFAAVSFVLSAILSLPVSTLTSANSAGILSFAFSTITISMSVLVMAWFFYTRYVDLVYKENNAFV